MQGIEYIGVCDCHVCRRADVVSRMLQRHLLLVDIAGHRSGCRRMHLGDGGRPMLGTGPVEKTVRVVGGACRAVALVKGEGTEALYKSGCQYVWKRWVLALSSIPLRLKVVGAHSPATLLSRAAAEQRQSACCLLLVRHDSTPIAAFWIDRHQKDAIRVARFPRPGIGFV